MKKMRDEALYAAYVQVLESGDFETLNEMAEYVVTQPAPQFFISSEKMSEYIGLVEHHWSLVNFNACSRRRIWTLYSMYKDWKQAFPDSPLARESILDILVNEPAPEFYLKASAARQIIQRVRKEKQEKIINKANR